MKLATMKCAVLSAATAAALETAVNDFVKLQGEATFIDIRFSVDAGLFAALILYAV